LKEIFGDKNVAGRPLLNCNSFGNLLHECFLFWRVM